MRPPEGARGEARAGGGARARGRGGARTENLGRGISLFRHRTGRLGLSSLPVPLPILTGPELLGWPAAEAPRAARRPAGTHYLVPCHRRRHRHPQPHPWPTPSPSAAPAPSSPGPQVRTRRNSTPREGPPALGRGRGGAVQCRCRADVPGASEPRGGAPHGWWGPGPRSRARGLALAPPWRPPPSPGEGQDSHFGVPLMLHP